MSGGGCCSRGQALRWEPEPGRDGARGVGPGRRCKAPSRGLGEPSEVPGKGPRGAREGACVPSRDGGGTQLLQAPRRVPRAGKAPPAFAPAGTVTWSRGAAGEPGGRAPRTALGSAFHSDVPKPSSQRGGEIRGREPGRARRSGSLSRDLAARGVRGVRAEGNRSAAGGDWEAGGGGDSRERMSGGRGRRWGRRPLEYGVRVGLVELGLKREGARTSPRSGLRGRTGREMENICAPATALPLPLAQHQPAAPAPAPFLPFLVLAAASLFPS